MNVVICCVVGRLVSMLNMEFVISYGMVIFYYLMCLVWLWNENRVVVFIVVFFVLFWYLWY